MEVFVLVEMVDVELLGVKVFRNRADAENAFHSMVNENCLTEKHIDLGYSILRSASYNAYRVVLLEKSII